MWKSWTPATRVKKLLFIIFRNFHCTKSSNQKMVRWLKNFVSLVQELNVEKTTPTQQNVERWLSYITQVKVLHSIVAIYNTKAVHMKFTALFKMLDFFFNFLNLLTNLSTFSHSDDFLAPGILIFCTLQHWIFKYKYQ